METWLFFLYTKGMNSLEILAPVGSPATLEAALQAGCDAIYCALPTFGARAYADNFTLEQMKEVVHRCHSLNVKVHVTMNTLLFEDEIEAAYQQAKQLYEIGVDALIVQDLGLIHLLHERLPQLCLHASTQLSITRPDQIEQCKKLGIQRVVLARECTKEQIQACIRTGIEVEVLYREPSVYPIAVNVYSVLWSMGAAGIAVYVPSLVVCLISCIKMGQRLIFLNPIY